VCQIANVSQLAEGYIEYLTDEKKWYKAQKVAIERVNRFYTQKLFLNNYREIYEKTFSQINNGE
jgi:hypothetical protein